LNRIEKGEWASGEMIPTERELASLYGVSVGSVKTAMLNLVNSGMLFRVQGKGTFVAGSVVGRDKRRLYHFVTDFESQNDPLSVRLHRMETVAGAIPACRYLKLPADGVLFRIERIFALHGSNVVVSVSYLPKRLFPGIDKLSHEFFEGRPLYQLFEEEYKLPTVRYQEMFSATEATREIADLLRLPEYAPLLSVEMLALTFKGLPLEYRVSYCHTKAVKLFRTPFKTKTHRWGG
jgi:GntR family transcriptional regulator